MSLRTMVGLFIRLCLLSFLLSGCFSPPFNNFRDDHRALRQIGFYGGIGAGAGAVVGSVVGSAGFGAVIGGATGASIGIYKNTRYALIKEMQDEQDMQLIEYGDTMTLIVPTDRYYVFNTPRLNDICYPGLNNIIRLLRYYPNTPIYVAGFTDDVGDRHHKRMLSQARAETMLTFLWAYDIPAQRLHAEGYADLHDVGDNHFIHTSAYNRRIEIQWIKGLRPTKTITSPISGTK
jgi:outer membrane protein OmpA-like peptidoglycan-associated protein